MDLKERLCPGWTHNLPEKDCEVRGYGGHTFKSITIGYIFQVSLGKHTGEES